MEFFSVTGLILVFGLGLDYIIYMMENEKRPIIPVVEPDTTVVECPRSGCIETTCDPTTPILEPFATAVSFLTTIISFGALALSSFKPVHLIGLSIFIGLATAYISSFFYGRNQNS